MGGCFCFGGFFVVVVVIAGSWFNPTEVGKQEQTFIYPFIYSFSTYYIFEVT